MPSTQIEHRYPCDNCGATLEFAPGQDALVCPYCGHVQTIAPDTRPPELPTSGGAIQWNAGHKAPGLDEIPLARGLSLDDASDLTETLRTLSCPNCGAKIEQLGTSHASTCPFCATPVVTDTGTTRLIKPQAVLPFVLSETQARAALDSWLKGLWFAPNGLVQYARRGRRMQGVYSPFWTFDADTQTRYRGQRGDHYYETVHVTRRVNGRNQQVAQQVRRTRWTPRSGHVARSFDDVLVLASTALPRRFTDALAPWELSHLATYDPRYLSGFSAEGYTVPLADGHQVARQEMASVIAMDIRRDIGGDVQRIDAVDTSHSAETFKHILLPVWLAAYKYNGKSYRFIVNGQSGRVQGDRPWSMWKIALAVLAALLAGAMLMLLSESSGSFDLGAAPAAAPAPAITAAAPAPPPTLA